MTDLFRPPDLAAFARRVLVHGPVRTLPTSRRIRILFNGTYIADTTRALFVWEHEYFPQYWVPLSSLKQGSWTKLDSIDNDAASILRITAGDRSTDRVVAFSEKLEKGRQLQSLQGMVRVEFAAADGWYEEDTPIAVHPKDPFKRIDILHSMRPVKVFIAGTQVASAISALHLFETSLPTRYYLPPTSVDPSFLKPSGTVTKCPYKGEAQYYDVLVRGQVYKDIVWYYKTPTLESSLVAGHLCFYNEKVDIELDGEKLERPVTKFA